MSVPGSRRRFVVIGMCSPLVLVSLLLVTVAAEASLSSQAPKTTPPPSDSATHTTTTIPDEGLPAAEKKSAEVIPSAVAPPVRTKQQQPATSLSSVVLDAAREVVDAGNACLVNVWRTVPVQLRRFVVAFSKGLSSSVAFGAGITSIVTPPQSTASGGSFVARLQATFTQNSLEYLYYSMGTIAADLAAFAVLLQFVVAAPKQQATKKPLFSFWDTHAGFFVLILIAAVPNGILDLSVPAALLLNVTTEAVVASVCIGKLLRPYVVVLLLYTAEYLATLDLEGSHILGAVIELHERVAKGGATAGEPSGLLMAVFWSAVIASVGLFTVTKLFGQQSDEDDELLLLDEDEN